MKKTIALFITFLSISGNTIWSAASPTTPKRLDFILGEEIAQSLRSISVNYKPQRMCEVSVHKKIELAIKEAERGNVSTALRRINLMIKEIDEDSSDSPLRTMLNGAKNGRDPYEKILLP